MNERELRDEIARLRKELALVSPPTFSRRLRIERKELNLTQKQFADKLGMTQGGYAQYEIGRREPSLKTLCRIADALHVSLDWLCGRVDENTFDEENYHERD